MLTDEIRYKIFKLVEAKPEISQRELAKELGISLGKANYCLNALINKGLIKVSNFRSSKNKKAYMYLLTPKGLDEKVSVAMRFLKLKVEEYEIIRKEIVQIRREIDGK